MCNFFNNYFRWFVYKHSKPLPADIVRFPPYPDTQDHYRGTTVLPYLETFFNYGVDDNGVGMHPRESVKSYHLLFISLSSLSLSLSLSWQAFFILFNSHSAYN